MQGGTNFTNRCAGLVVCGVVGGAATLAAGQMAMKVEPVGGPAPAGVGERIGPAGAVLWDQQPDLSENTWAVHDQESADFPEGSAYIVNDVMFDSAVTITSVTTYFSWFSQGFPIGEDVLSARLNIFPKTSSLPADDDDPRLGMSVPVDVSEEMFDGLGLTWVFEADDLSIDLPAGAYWVGLTPQLEFGEWGFATFHSPALMVGDVSASRVPDSPGDGDWNPISTPDGPWDAAITIHGTVIPSPGTLGLVGVGGLMAACRRRRV